VEPQLSENKRSWGNLLEGHSEAEDRKGHGPSEKVYNLIGKKGMDSHVAVLKRLLCEEEGKRQRSAGATNVEKNQHLLFNTEDSDYETQERRKTRRKKNRMGNP